VAPKSPSELPRPYGWSADDLAVTLAPWEMNIGNIPSRDGQAVKVRQEVALLGLVASSDKSGLRICWHARPDPYIPSGLTLDRVRSFLPSGSLRELYFEEKYVSRPPRSWYLYLVRAVQTSPGSLSEFVSNTSLTFSVPRGGTWVRRSDRYLERSRRSRSPWAMSEFLLKSVGTRRRRPNYEVASAVEFKWLGNYDSVLRNGHSKEWLRGAVVQPIPVDSSRIRRPFSWGTSELDVKVICPPVQLFCVPPARSSNDAFLVHTSVTLAWSPKPHPFVPCNFDAKEYIELLTKFGYPTSLFTKLDERQLYEKVVTIALEDTGRDALRSMAHLGSPQTIPSQLFSEVRLSFCDRMGYQWLLHGDGKAELVGGTGPKSLGSRSAGLCTSIHMSGVYGPFPGSRNPEPCWET
jgi:hypothetical protein